MKWSGDGAKLEKEGQMNLGNILEAALSVLPAVSFRYRAFRKSEVDEFGQKRPEYGEWKVCRGMVQPVNRTAYEDMGLDFSKNYVNAWGSIPLETVSDETSPGQILYNGRLWNITAVNEWNQYNGWTNVTAVQDRMWNGE